MANDFKFTSNLPNVTKALQSAREASLESIGDLITESARRKTAVDTGRAKAGWGFSVADDTVTIGNSVKHMVYLEYGTRRMRAQPALRPAVDESTREIESIVKAKLKAKLG